MLSVPGPSREDFLQEQNPKQILEKKAFLFGISFSEIPSLRDCRFGSDEMFPAPTRRRSITDWK